MSSCKQHIPKHSKSVGCDKSKRSILTLDVILEAGKPEGP